MSGEKSVMFDEHYGAPPSSTSPPPALPPPSLLYEFATETSAHGVSKIAKADSKAKKVAWGVALLAAFVVAAMMIGIRYIHKPTLIIS